ncbi:MAG TPA: hypothetical protein VHG28_02215 [Longimicrobiaceae bacterium]|nr:hypothetical protein [Longimicrobiaceae bacterium]
MLQLIGNTEEFAPAALVNLAEGARAFGDWTQAGRSAKLALEMARSRKDAEPERVALEVLRNIAGREPLPREAEPEHRQRIENLIRRFMVRLRKAPGQHQPGADPKTVPESVVTG